MGGRHWGMGKWFCCLLALLYCCASHAGAVHYYYTDPQGNVLAKADAQGNMISFINSNYEYFGSGIVVPGTGFALQAIRLVGGIAGCTAGWAGLYRSRKRPGYRARLHAGALLRPGNRAFPEC